ncbi:S-layer homology domain-containing protein [Megasphaera elsdenii]|uniref:S-layer homology domain-containing protein n=1 Tax=Megasphaera elsdenii TaxID=907 RepID=UPI0019592204|nr:S-layer homology domain-containing protein [Megasphaera elsdenii]MBM6702861.1 S-layer homology domain-containing protein [Megasphaera elsdenii]
MKTKVVAALAATMAIGATCAFAANPFVDVPSDSWAYKSVVELADAGIIQGVDGQYFQGNRNITRYEAAEMVAKAMAHMDKASVEQRALINKLADEYADELNNLGVRVSALENRVGNVKLTGDARVRYIHQDSDDKGNGEVKNDDSWTYRVRVRANAQVNDRTKVVYGVSTDNVSFADNSTASNSDKNNIFTDRAYVDYNFGGNNWDLMVGRYEYDMGGGRAYGFLYGDTFDGAQLKYGNDKFAATAGYGKFKEGIIGGKAGMASKTAYGELEGFFGGGRVAGSAVGVYYNNIMPQDDADNTDVWGAYGSLNLGKWNAFANYENYKDAIDGKDDAEVWIGKLTYNKANFATPKSWDAWVEYLNADNAFADGDGNFVGSTLSWRNGNLLNNVKSWGAGIDYTFAKNAQFQVMQSFASEAKEGSNDPGEETRAQFVFVF